MTTWLPDIVDMKLVLLYFIACIVDVE